MIYLKYFEKENDYYSFLAADYTKPNVSFINEAEKNMVNYNKSFVAVTYEILEGGVSSWLLTAPTSFSKMIIKGKTYDLMPRVSFATPGDYTVFYLLKEGVNSLAEQTFYKASTLTGVDNVRVKSIKLPEEITRLEKWSLGRCEFEEFIIPDTVTTLPASPGIFYRNEKTVEDATLKKVHFGKGIEVIPQYTITHQPLVEEVTWTNNLKRIEDYGLGSDIYCRNTNIETINLGKGIEYVGSYAFAQTSLKNLIIPCDNVLQIKGDSFTGTYIGMVPGYSGSYKPGGSVVYVPDSLMDAYRADSMWSKLFNAEDDRVVTLKGLSELPSELDKFMYND